VVYYKGQKIALDNPKLDTSFDYDGYYPMCYFDKDNGDLAINNACNSTEFIKAESKAHYDFLWKQLSAKGWSKPNNLDSVVFLVKNMPGYKTKAIGVLDFNSGLSIDEEDENNLNYNINIDLIYVSQAYRKNKAYREIFMKLIIDTIYDDINKISQSLSKIEDFDFDNISFWLSAECHSKGGNNFIQSILDNYNFCYENIEENDNNVFFKKLLEKEFMEDDIDWHIDIKKYISFDM